MKQLAYIIFAKLEKLNFHYSWNGLELAEVAIFEERRVHVRGE